MKRTAATLLSITSIAAACAACSPGGGSKSNSAAQPSITSVAESPSSQTATASSGAVQTITQTQHVAAQPNGSTKSSSNGGNCSTEVPWGKINSEIIPQLDQPTMPPWKWDPQTMKENYNTCADLSFVELRETGAWDGGYDTVLLLFHKGEYLGADSKYLQHIISISNQTDRSFTVRYSDFEAARKGGARLEPGGPKADDFHSDVNFSWDGSKVQTDGRFPNLNYGPRGSY